MSFKPFSRRQALVLAASLVVLTPGLTLAQAKLKESMRNLASFPRLGAVPPELEGIHGGQFRQLICGMNRIIYELRQDTVYVHIIVDTRRDLSALLMRRLFTPGT